MTGHRMAVVHDLVALARPLQEIKKKLAEFPFDYTGIPYLLTASAVRNVIDLYESRQISPNELREWANLVEMRDDIKADTANLQMREWILATIFSLANDELTQQNIETTLKAIKDEYARIVQ